MSKLLSRKRKQDYESDDGFVEDAPKSKNPRKEPKQVNSAVQKDDDGNEYWELSGKRRVQVSEFKGTTMVGVREFYEKDGKMLPGKKGISLSIDQYSALINLLPSIEKALKGKGVSVPRPQYDGKETAGSEDAEEEEEEKSADDEEMDDDDEEATSKPSSKLNKYKMKPNHEATSDEEE